MDDKKIRQVLKTYRAYFQTYKIAKRECDHAHKVLGPGPFWLSPDRRLEHCHTMLDQMEQFLKDGRRDKVFRWLGFLQGVLWSTGCYTLDELKNHNRPD